MIWVHPHLCEPPAKMRGRRSLPGCSCPDDWWHEINFIWRLLAETL